MFGWFKKRTTDNAPVLQWVEYKGFRVAAAPTKEGSQYRVGAQIEKTVGEDVKNYSFVRADLISDLDEANDISLMKAKLIVDQQGDRMFDGQ